MQELEINRMFKEDEGMFYRRINGKKKRQGKVPEMDKFVTFWAGIWEDDNITPNRKWMETVAENIRAKITNVEEMTINEEKLYETIKKRKNRSAPGIDAIQNFL